MFSGKFLTEITIPDAVKEIKDGTFEGCSALTTVEGATMVESIGTSAFQGTSSLTMLRWITFNGAPITNKITSIGASAFKESGLVGEIVIPDGVTEIGASAHAHQILFHYASAPQSSRCCCHCALLPRLPLRNSLCVCIRSLHVCVRSFAGSKVRHRLHKSRLAMG